MSLRNDSELVGFDAERALRAAREAVDGDVFLCVEYDATEFNVLYADERTTALYADRERMIEHFSSIHDYVGVDFTERDLFEEMFRAAGDVSALVTHMEHVTLLRVLTDDNEGLFMTLPPDAETNAVVEAVDSVLDEAD